MLRIARQKMKIDWVTTLFLVVTPIGSAITLWLVPPSTISASILVAAAIYLYLTGMSITGGYHRLFAHKTYSANKVVEWAYLLFGAGAFQGSALKWGADHRIHHRFVDGEKDPYSINKGLWYAHIGWLFDKLPEPDYQKWAPDLLKNPRVKFQHKHFVLIGSFMAFLLPGFIGLVIADSFLLGALYIGLIRLVVLHHTTFFINSLCHFWGKQPYSDAHTARDSHILAVLTYGEGYHNFHHEFQGDYRNGVKWYQWDPTKWLILSLHKLGWANGLKEVSPFKILEAQIQQRKKRALSSGVRSDVLEQWAQRTESARARWKETFENYHKAKESFKLSLREKHNDNMVAFHQKVEDFHTWEELKKSEFRKKIQELKRDMRQARKEYKRSWASLTTATA
ncbi:MAG: hypothetical protein COT74_02875 [Bdellovibrionales bacterium CG10_big_fil_rev_8_21_14_0_10_45_34]|nr:MAG: hypothetical protein COT74_02875 [Bdellovibrionales bacterium CG10_big_fil_rev_8_21_14_0_10_45_34]